LRNSIIEINTIIENQNKLFGEDGIIKLDWNKLGNTKRQNEIKNKILYMLDIVDLAKDLGGMIKPII